LRVVRNKTRIEAEGNRLETGIRKTTRDGLAKRKVRGREPKSSKGSEKLSIEEERAG